MSGKDKKLQRTALRDFLQGVPDTFERATASLRWLVVLVGVALGALLLHLVFGPGKPPPMPPPGGPGDNPVAALYVRDLGRLPDGRHTFDLVYDLVLRNATRRDFEVVRFGARLALGDLVKTGDVLELNDAPPVGGDGRAHASGTVVWHQPLPETVVASGGLAGFYAPGQWRRGQSHFRINARVEQIADIAISYDFGLDPHWFDDAPAQHRAGFAHDEEVQLGAVVRAHCPLGIKVQNGEMRSLCGS